MFHIDGSIGEGGGQVLRTALSASVILGEAVKIEKIRAGRSPPGLKPQHLTAVRALSEISGAEVKGDRAGSTELYFRPSGIHGGDYLFDTGTAGSMTLVIQAILPALLSADSSSTVILRGGSDVKWSPPADHTKHVLLPALSRMGADIEMDIVRRGYYPKGGGELRLRVSPSRLDRLELKGGWTEKIEGLVHCSNLPEHVPKRIKHAAMKELPGFPVDIRTSCGNSPSTGAGIVLWANGDGYAIGGSCPRERGLPSEKVGKMGALSLKKALGFGADEHLADQLLIYMAMSGSGSIFTPEISSHTATGISLLEKLNMASFSTESSSINGRNGFVIDLKKT